MQHLASFEALRLQKMPTALGIAAFCSVESIRLLQRVAELKWEALSAWVAVAWIQIAQVGLAGAETVLVEAAVV